jgi:hypothetical protein
VLGIGAAQLGMDHSQAVKMVTEFKPRLQGVGKYFEVVFVRVVCVFLLSLEIIALFLGVIRANAQLQHCIA